ncbi:hypothetical protein SAMN04487970_100680 [Paenibacillus tianmuensis]|uniref:Uncharacterized protein n=1 Tax=Paenibacillus tianmuensis TaxID=624147 RepID=A0A1G4QAY9_9BACL|nr:hypothetical protein [Paenibacillus tianmuensis]SCW41740.1 hypothetical protein SAMN04487970_100680 [Paenibacillus tianmuensis]
MVYSYFEDKAIVFDTEGTYADQDAKLNNTVTYGGRIRWAPS